MNKSVEFLEGLKNIYLQASISCQMLIVEPNILSIVRTGLMVNASWERHANYRTLHELVKYEVSQVQVCM